MGVNTTLYISRNKALETYFGGLEDKFIEEVINSRLKDEDRLIRVVVTDDATDDEEFYL